MIARCLSHPNTSSPHHPDAHLVKPALQNTKHNTTVPVIRTCNTTEYCQALSPNLVWTSSPMNVSWNSKKTNVPFPTQAPTHRPTSENQKTCSLHAKEGFSRPTWLVYCVIHLFHLVARAGSKGCGPGRLQPGLAPSNLFVVNNAGLTLSRHEEIPKRRIGNSGRSNQSIDVGPLPNKEPYPQRGLVLRPRTES
ncbi:hypothetical protein L209DRAFT_501886 [Thermothelomyces heterothallicus CBS 203.75]